MKVILFFLLMKKLNKWPWKSISLGFLILVVIALVFGQNAPSFMNGSSFLSSYDTSSVSAPQMKSMGEAGGSAANRVMNDGYAYEESALSILPPNPSGTPAAVDVKRRELIRNGRLSLIVADVNQAINDVKKEVDNWDGFVEEANMNNYDEEGQSGWMRLRVDAKLFDQAFETLKSFALKVESESVSVDDVTGQVVDTEARLTNLRAQEQQYLDILSRAETIEETLQATEYLNRIRNDIEWTERSLKTVTEQVALSTITLNLIDEGNVEVLGFYWTPWLNVKKSARAALENLTDSVDTLIAFGLNLPLALIWGALLLIVLRLGWKALKKYGLL